MNLRELMNEELPGALPVIVGDHENGYLAFDLADMPHLLIAGTTGSGKSVMVNAILCSLLSWASTDDLRLVLMDFKRVELAPYRPLPHLLLPVITEYDDAMLALRWLVAEMELRFRILEREGLRSIDEYEGSMPYIVVVIDEMADLILGLPEAEKQLVRLAQKSRAVGIHLIMSTQRPTTNVVTGLIKANVPGRMAFAVVSRLESMIIIDQPGAETLIGRGDVLFRDPSTRRLIHGQGAYVDIDTIQAIVEFATEREHGQQSLPQAEQPTAPTSEGAHHR